MSGKYYGIEIDSIEDDLENIECFVNEGTPVIITGDLSDLEFVYGIEENDVEIV